MVGLGLLFFSEHHDKRRFPTLVGSEIQVSGSLVADWGNFLVWEAWLAHAPDIFGFSLFANKDI